MGRILVALVVVVVVVGAVLAMAGVLHFRSADHQATITIDKKELKEKTDKAVEKTEAVGSEILDKTGQILHKAAAGLRESAPIGTRRPQRRRPMTTTPASRTPTKLRRRTSEPCVLLAFYAATAA